MARGVLGGLAVTAVVGWIDESCHVIVVYRGAAEGIRMCGLPPSRTRATRDRVYSRIVATGRAVPSGFVIEVLPPVEAGMCIALEGDIMIALLEEAG